MTIGCNIWMICLELNWFVYDPSWMLHLSEFVWTLCSSVLVVLNNFLLIDATDRSKISSDQKRFFIALSLYPLSFFVHAPFKCTNSTVMFTGCICGIKMLGRLYRRFRFYEKLHESSRLGPLNYRFHATPLPLVFTYTFM